MGKVSLTFFKKDCMGCHACEVACKQEHDLGVGPRLVRIIEQGCDFTPVYCHHCAKAPCLEACPVDAIDRNAEGVVLIEGDTCIGCRACMEACPFGAMQFDEAEEVAVKCDRFYNRLQEGRGPACAAVCPTQCISGGDAKAVTERMDRKLAS
jgi:Fe-S-cluster-containing dehydrogenase component